MQLTGTQEERVAAAIEFYKVRRSPGLDHDAVVEAYRKAGVPFTEAAEKLFREWNGVFDGERWYEEGHSYRMDFFMSLFNCDFSFYEHKPVDESAEDENLSAPAIMRKHYGADTVPVGYGGYYYQGYVFICPDGKLLMWHDYNPRDEFWEYDSLDELIQGELSFHCVGRVEKIVDRVGFEGSVEERLLAAVQFARKHGGFKNCQLIRYNGFPFDTSRMPADLSLPDGELCELLLKIMQEQELLGEHDIKWMFIVEE